MQDWLEELIDKLVAIGAIHQNARPDSAIINFYPARLFFLFFILNFQTVLFLHTRIIGIFYGQFIACGY